MIDAAAAGIPADDRPADQRIAELEEQIARFRRLATEEKIELAEVIETLEARRRQIYDRLDGWQKTLIARHKNRPLAADYIKGCFTDWVELSGDRLFKDDPAIMAGLAFLQGMPVVVVATEKGRSTNEKILRNFGMPHPEGYRKSIRVMKLAAKFGRPIVTLVDTPGAYPGIGAEERGQAGAIAENLKFMADLPVPTVAVVIGEGGSGGALALAVANRVLMLEYAIYSVISPEGCASILWRDGVAAPLAANALKLTARDLKALDVVDEVIGEPVGGAHHDPLEQVARVREALVRHVSELRGLGADVLRDNRYDRFRVLGRFAENA